MSLEIEFVGTRHMVDHEPFAIGRAGDLVIDENPFLHRSFLTLARRRGSWVLTNSGDRLTATLADPAGKLEAFLAPGGVFPIVTAETVVRFSAGPTSYEFTLHLLEPPSPTAAIAAPISAETTIGKVALTTDQKRMIVALAEPVLRGSGRAASVLPSSGEAARRLGWTTTKFTRKLDNVCDKLTKVGVRGLHGSPGQLASNRRARLVEYAMAVRLVTRDDLEILETGGPS